MGFQFRVSTLGSQDMASKCEDIAQVSSLLEFPVVNNDKLINYNKEHDSKSWELVNNNDLMNGVTECVPGIEPKCTIKVLDDIDLQNFYAKIGLAVRLSLTEVFMKSFFNLGTKKGYKECQL